METLWKLWGNHFVGPERPAWCFIYCVAGASSSFWWLRSIASSAHCRGLSPRSICGRFEDQHQTATVEERSETQLKACNIEIAPRWKNKCKDGQFRCMLLSLFWIVYVLFFIQLLLQLITCLVPHSWVVQRRGRRPWTSPRNPKHQRRRSERTLTSQWSRCRPTLCSSGTPRPTSKPRIPTPPLERCQR